jgi:hypothetical protein
MFTNKHKVFATFTLSCLVLAGLQLALAQSPENAGGDDSSDGEISVRRRADLSPQEQLTEAHRIEERGVNVSQRLMSMLDEARRERDIIRVTCLNDKLTQVNAHRRSLETRVSALEESVNVREEDRSNHEFTVISVLGQHFRTLEQEANACIGQDIFETGTTRVVTDIDPATPDEDVSEIAEPPAPTVPFIPVPESVSM